MTLRVIYVRAMSILAMLLFGIGVSSQNTNFHIYLCFGQSNMEGQGPIEAEDKIVDSRFKVLQSLDCSGRNKNTWYTAIPPLCQCNTGLSPADYFGKTMVKYLPDSITVGVINVAVGGSDIRLFDKDLYQDYVATYNENWYLSKIQAYNGNPRKHLMDLARLAQQDGVIKGILIHQGEANTGNNDWPLYVKKIYDEMLAELSLDANEVPLLAGEVLSAPGNCCGTWMNPIINKLPLTVPTAHVISAEGLTGQDPAHFDTPSYRKLGVRYAAKMLSLMGVEANIVVPEYYYFEPECSAIGANWNMVTDGTASGNTYVTIKPGMNNTAEVSTDRENAIYFDLTTQSDTTFYVYARVLCATLKSDSFWFKMDDGPFEFINGLPKGGSWTWVKVKSYNLKAGLHTLAIANGEEGARLDKVYVSNIDFLPSGKGNTAVKACNPKVYSVPGKIEAESYTYQLGVLTETTGDTDGGSDVTGIDTNDYMEYLVDAPTDTIYKATFRYASPVSNGAIAVLLDEVSIGFISLPGTGGSQIYKSVTTDIPLKAGRHTLKLMAASGGFKLNWFMFEKDKATGINNLSDDNVSVYPIPTSGVLNVNSSAFQFSMVEIVDNTGKLAYSKKISPTNSFSFNPGLPSGVYVLRLVNSETIRNFKILVE